MHLINIAAPSFEADPDDPPGYHSGMLRLGHTLPAVKSGISVYEIPPGQRICPYHYEVSEEEWVLVLEGEPTFRDPEGEHGLVPWDVVFCPAGPGGAHQVINHTQETVRVLMFSNREYPAVCVYPDSDKVGVYSSEGESLMVHRSADVDYFDGEPDVSAGATLAELEDEDHG